MNRIASATSLLLVAAGGLAAAEGAPASSKLGYYNTPKQIILSVPDISTVAKARFFVSPDGGKTWKLERELAVASGAREAPRMEFRPQTDGVYTIATCAVWRSGKSEADPQPGSIPQNGYTIVIDTIKPVIGTVTAVLQRTSDERAIVEVQWTASDPNFGADPVAVEASTDGGITYGLSFPGAAQGAMKVTVPAPRGTAAIDVRVVAKDLAGNSAQSAVSHVALPPPPDPAVELKKAVSSLPALTELEPSARPADGTDGDSKKPTAGAVSAKPQVIEPATASADPSRPDIIAPNGLGDTTVASPADGAVVSGTNVESEYHHRIAEAKGGAPDGFKPQHRVTDEAAKKPEAAEPAIEEEATFLPNPGAEVVLEQAREKAKAGDRDGALKIYRRLHNSGAAKLAISEELDLLRSMGEQRRIIEVVDAMPPEIITDGARLHQARALISLGEHAEALNTLSRVRAGAPEAREAMFLIGKCFKAQGKAAQAKKVFSTLAGGSDDIATAAKGEL